MNSHAFALTTRQAARLASIEAYELYSHVKRRGHWSGVTPTKMPNGRLLWPKAGVLRAIGIVPAGSEPVDLRAWIALVEEAGLPADESMLRVGFSLLTERFTAGRNPAYVVDELDLVAQAVRAAVGRLACVQSDLLEVDQRRVLAALQFIADTAAGKGEAQ